MGTGLRRDGRYDVGMDIFGIAGWSGSGKTTLIRALIPALAARGLRIGTIKHSHHDLSLGEAEQRDLVAAGGVETVVAGPARVQWIGAAREDRDAPGLAELARKMAGIDILLVEGFKFSRHPRLEVWNSAVGKPMLALTDPSIVAVAADIKRPPFVPPMVAWFLRDEVQRIAAFVQVNCIPLGELRH